MQNVENVKCKKCGFEPSSIVDSIAHKQKRVATWEERVIVTCNRGKPREEHRYNGITSEIEGCRHGLRSMQRRRVADECSTG